MFVSFELLHGYCMNEHLNPKVLIFLFLAEATVEVVTQELFR